jgi:LmbE family N-acetylglucosaminyl deacetylase
VGAHPDDIDYLAGGTVAKFAAAGAEIYYLILTGGGKGTDDPDLSAADLIATRRAEQQTAAKILGVTEVFFADFEDGQLENMPDLRQVIVRYIRQIKPDTVIGWDPAFYYSVDHGFPNHRDHRIAGEATLDAAYPEARNQATYPELLSDGLEPHTVSRMLLLNLAEHNHAVDISGYMKQKISAMEAHSSQFVPADKAMVIAWAESIGKISGHTASEGFKLLEIRI